MIPALHLMLLVPLRVNTFTIKTAALYEMIFQWETSAFTIILLNVIVHVTYQGFCQITASPGDLVKSLKFPVIWPSP